MIIWVALETENQMPETKRDVMKIASSLGRADLPCLALPLHLSLKISFPVPEDKAEAVRRAIREIFAGVAPFPIRFRGAERRDGLIWLSAEPEFALRTLHEALDEKMREGFDVPQTVFDRDFRFHVTLFQDLEDAEAAKALGAVEACVLPSRIWAKSVLIGSSPGGLPGTFRVDEILPLSDPGADR